MPSAFSFLDDDEDDLPAAATRPGDRKLQRLVDILAALLVRQFPASFVDLASDVPEYREKLDAMAVLATDAEKKRAFESLKRVFERDKDDLRSFGVQIIDPKDDAATPNEQAAVYRLKGTDFYLPYLALMTPSGAVVAPKKLSVDGYKALTTLALEPDELAAIVQAAASIRSLGDTVLRADVESALRKLAVDLPVDAPEWRAGAPRVITERVQPDRGVFDALSMALRRKKSVRFEYHSMQADRTAEREVDPYGLFFGSGHWYLVARDREQQALRNFRLQRIRQVRQLNTRHGTPDFSIPPDFSLREHGRTRQAWELGDDNPMLAVVAFVGASGPTLAAAALGSAGASDPTHRQFTVRRPDVFARWVLSFAGEVRVISPPELAAQVMAMAQAARALYASDHVTNVDPAPAVQDDGRARTPWNPSTAADKLRRLLVVLPEIADGEDHSIADVAARAGCDEDTIVGDLHSLAARVDEPGGFIDKFNIAITADTVSARSRHLRRPLRLTSSELCALHLGLAVLRSHRPPDEWPLLDRARRRLQDILGTLRDPIPDSLYAVSLGEEGSIERLTEVRDATRQRRKIRIAYRKSGSAVTRQRAVCPYTLLVSRGMMYLVAYCEDAAAVRIFRMDRVVDVELLDETFTAPAYDIEQIARDGRVFMGGEHDTMLVRYSPRIARWIAEREQRSLAADGSLVLDHPLADVEWAVRHVLQYGPDAEVLAPPSLRARVRETLDAILE